jgi:hypothetical protein
MQRNLRLISVSVAFRPKLVKLLSQALLNVTPPS